MKLLVEIPDDVKEAFDNASKDNVGIEGLYYDYRLCIGQAIQNGTILSDNHMIIDKDKLEKDSDYSGYYDAYCAYSDIAIEAAEIEI